MGKSNDNHGVDIQILRRPQPTEMIQCGTCGYWRVAKMTDSDNKIDLGVYSPEIKKIWQGVGQDEEGGTRDVIDGTRDSSGHDE